MKDSLIVYHNNKDSIKNPLIVDRNNKDLLVADHNNKDFLIGDPDNKDSIVVEIQANLRRSRSLSIKFCFYVLSPIIICISSTCIINMMNSR